MIGTLSATVAPPPAKARVFFPNLDGLRFLSFFVVFLFHWYMTVFPYISGTNPTAGESIRFLFQYGGLGVNFFFVLSGFLITYLLIRERELTGKIHVGNFYVRRILRIWPLYFLCLAIAFILFPMLKQMGGEVYHERVNPWYYVTFLANFEYMRIWPEHPEAVLVSVLWSVAVEEQFYLTWPLILRIVPVKFYKYVFILIMIGSLVFRSFYTADTDHDYAVRYFHTFSVIGDMALGGLLAWLCSFPNKFQQWVVNMKRPVIALIYIGAIAASLFKSVLFPAGIPIIFERLVMGMFFGMIILEQNYAEKSFFKLGRLRLLSRLGTYTYGLYCLHLLGIYIATKIVLKLGWDQRMLSTAFAQVIIALPLSLVISIASYHLYEKWFLKLKDRFAFITK
ncbi:acyltransferase [Pseudoflavitalea sp. G-6-1-2]|uniref:acyltransferase family protein n=1 Tax=Pseudoflavitalea sp. G-6-1-2 TaxID=2728841 RepID=UPI00146BDDEC|nr:acyltransferase [Pseudoflavitalea sp. G-6-1-2]NML19332.1 acyltransferase [Pseudoflavitalea sp. G-6-1-2]